MRVSLLYFGILKDSLGSAGGEVEVPSGATVGVLLRILERQTSKGIMDRDFWRTLAVAVNREYSSPEVVLREGDEVALLPPVSGGCFAKAETLASLGTASMAKSSLRSQRPLYESERSC
jgi:molybdopterin converting factor subunit 1